MLRGEDRLAKRSYPVHTTANTNITATFTTTNTTIIT